MKDEKTGDDLVSIGFVVDLEYADATTSAHDLLQQFKTAPARQEDPRGRRARRLGREGAAGRRLLVDAQALDAGRAARRRRRRHGRHGRAQGRAPLHQVRHARRRGDLRRAQAAAATSFESYEDAIEESSIGKELYEVRNTRQPFQKGFIKGGPLVNLMIATKGKFPGGRWSWHRNDAQRDVRRQDARDSYPKPDGKYTFDKLSSVFITGNATRDDAPNHIRVQKHVPREVAETWDWMCPAGVYEIPDDAPETRQRRRDRQLHELRAVRRDHRQGRAPDDARGRRRPALPAHLSARRRRRTRRAAAAIRAGRNHAPSRVPESA